MVCNNLEVVFVVLVEELLDYYIYPTETSTTTDDSSNTEPKLIIETDKSVGAKKHFIATANDVVTKKDIVNGTGTIVGIV